MLGSRVALSTSMRTAIGLVFLSSASALRVCTNTACKKAGSRDTLETLRVLAACSAEASTRGATVPAATLQAAFGASRVDSCGCLGRCGRGPNCVDDVSGEVFYDVYKPSAATSLLEEVEHLDIPDAAVTAWLKKMYAIRSMRAGDFNEALSLVTMALNEAGTLRTGGSHLLSLLLDLRADIHAQLRDRQAAEADRVRAEKMRQLLPEGTSAASGIAV